MTRINTIAPADLLDQHLFIEFREITRIATVHRHLTNRERVTEYVLGTGHMKFFYDKGWYCEKRLNALQDELKRRGSVNFATKDYKPHVSGYHNDWQPNTAAHVKNISRLHEKLMMRPQFYKYCGKSVSQNFYLNLLNHYVQKPREITSRIAMLESGMEYADHPEYSMLKSQIAELRRQLTTLARSPYHGCQTN